MLVVAHLCFLRLITLLAPGTHDSELPISLVSIPTTLVAFQRLTRYANLNYLPEACLLVFSAAATSNEKRVRLHAGLAQPEVYLELSKKCHESTYSHHAACFVGRKQ